MGSAWIGSLHPPVHVLFSERSCGDCLGKSAEAVDSEAGEQDVPSEYSGAKHEHGAFPFLSKTTRQTYRNQECPCAFAGRDGDAVIRRAG